MITIVTSRTYLLCEAINHISMQFNPERINATKVIPYYDVYIDFVPVSRGNQSNRLSDTHVLTLRVAGEQVALKMFKEIVSQIREQMPDQIYLDKMVEDILTGAKDIKDELGKEKVPRTRKKKRGSKAVLRAAPASGKRSRR